MHAPDPSASHPYTTTLSNVNIYGPDLMRPGDVLLRDVVHSLAMLCRFNGHLREFYSVAEHSVLVAALAEFYGDDEAIIPALLHDAHEAYTGDVPRPVKRLVPEFAAYEAKVEAVVRKGLDLPGPAHAVWGRVAEYDNAILHREMKTLRKVTPDWYDEEVELEIPAHILPRCWAPEHARQTLGWNLRQYGYVHPAARI